MRILVFCGTFKALEKYEAQPDWLTCANWDNAEDLLHCFATDPEGKLAVTRSFALGWKAPECFVLFDASWQFAPDHPMTLQALGRSRRIGKAAELGMMYGTGRKEPPGDIYRRFVGRWPELSRAWRDSTIDTRASWPPWLAAQDGAD